jgi:hypothetical protein
MSWVMVYIRELVLLASSGHCHYTERFLSFLILEVNYWIEFTAFQIK